MARPEPKVRLIAVDDTRATKKFKTAEPDPVEDIRSAQKDYISADDISASGDQYYHDPEQQQEHLHLKTPHQHHHQIYHVA